MTDTHDAPMRGPWRRWARAEADEIRRASQWRRPRDLDAAGPAGELVEEGRPVVSYASNDYLGLSAHPAVVAAAHEALERWGAGAGASRLVVGSRPVHSALEADLADWKDAETALLFPTGYAANLGVLATFGGPDVLICSDELNHASIIDGCRLSRARTAVYRHRDLDHLDELLQGSDRAIVVTDTVFSMDGDVAPVEELARLCDRRAALLVLDEAHAVLGPELSARARTGTEVLRVGTLSKTLGSLGGFVAGPADLVSLLVNRARPFIFTTATSPPDAAAARAALAVLRGDEGATRIRRLRSHVERLRPGHPSPIVPVIIGDERETLAAAAALLREGILVPAIRPPTVAAGTSRLRVALSAAHRDDQIDRLLAALGTVVTGAPGG